jgi:hypothetical protein
MMAICARKAKVDPDDPRHGALMPNDWVCFATVFLAKYRTLPNS